MLGLKSGLYMTWTPLLLPGKPPALPRVSVAGCSFHEAQALA